MSELITLLLMSTRSTTAGRTGVLATESILTVLRSQPDLQSLLDISPVSTRPCFTTTTGPSFGFRDLGYATCTDTQPARSAQIIVPCPSPQCHQRHQYLTRFSSLKPGSALSAIVCLRRGWVLSDHARRHAQRACSRAWRLARLARALFSLSICLSPSCCCASSQVPISRPLRYTFHQPFL